jgi:RNA polymerase sigma-70 factor, ECF subfamily
MRLRFFTTPKLGNVAMVFAKVFRSPSASAGSTINACANGFRHHRAHGGNPLVAWPFPTWTSTMCPCDDRGPGQLLRLIKAGDGPALGTLLERYRNYLTLLVRVQIGKRLQGKVDPDDLLQETFLEAHRGIGRFRGETEQEFLAWLRQILAAILANQIRRYFGTKRRDLRLERELADDLDRSSCAIDGALVAPQSSPSHQASRREQSILLADALQRLPEDYREVIILRQLEDLSFPEVSRRMGRSEDSVKNLWARALAKLRRMMEDPR